MKKIIEIRAAEGGEDSKLFVNDLADSYIRLANNFGWKSKIVDNRQGQIFIEIVGENLSFLKNEAGGHRIQRIPPTEKRGRVHTSTVTVAIIDEIKSSEIVLSENDLKIEWYSGTGAGGQHRNKHQNSCRLTHIPTGIIVKSETRSRQNSYDYAIEELKKRLNDKFQNESIEKISKIRKSQVGSGMRGDKIRTYRLQDNVVTDHITNKKSRCSDVLKGNHNLLWW